MPAAQIAYVLDLSPLEVDLHLAIPSLGAPVFPSRYTDKRGSVRTRLVADAEATRIGRLASLGYDIERIGEILCLHTIMVKYGLKLVTPVRRSALVRPRTRKELRRLEKNRRDQAKRAALRAALALWRRCASPLDDAGSPAAIVPTDDELLDIVFEPETPPPCPVEPTHWEQRGHQRTRWGEEHGQAKLTRELAAEIRQDAAAGVSVYELARRHGVAEGTISAIVKGRTWLEPPPDAARDDERPPQPSPSVANQVDATNSKRQRWRSAPGTPKWGARGSGSLYDDDVSEAASMTLEATVIPPDASAPTRWTALPDDVAADVADDH